MRRSRSSVLAHGRRPVRGARRRLSWLVRRPLVAKPYLGAWLVCLWSVFVGIGAYDVSLRPLAFGGVDDRRNYDVYHHAAEAFLAGEDFYADVGLGEFYTYLYPPITIYGFVPFSWLEPARGYIVFTALTLVACAGATLAIASYVEEWDLTLGWVDVAAIWLFFVASTHSTGSINYGNVNLLLAAGIAVGFVALEREREFTAGALFGAVALLKVFPAIVGLYLLRIRSWRGVAGAVAVGGGGLVASAVVLGTDTLRRFFVEVLGDRSETDAFVGGYDPADIYYVTIQRPLSHALWEVWPDAPAHALPVVGALVLVPILGYCFVGVETRTDRLVAAHATLTASVIVMPSLRWYLALVFATWVPLCYVWAAEPASVRRRHGVLYAFAGLVVVAGIGYELYGQVLLSRWWVFVPIALAALALLVVWQGEPVLPLFVAGGLLASLTTSPSGMLERAATYPGPLEAVFEVVYAVATLQLYGLLVMLAACVLYKRRQGVGLGTAIESGRRLREEIADGLGAVRARARP